MEKSEVIAFLESENIKDRDFIDSGMQDYIAEIILKWEVLQSHNRMMQPKYDYVKKHFTKDGWLLDPFTSEEQEEIRKEMRPLTQEIRTGRITSANGDKYFDLDNPENSKV